MPNNPDGEAKRLRTLHAYGVLDTPAEPEFDTIVRQAAAAVGTPMALVSLIDQNRQWFKAKVGITVSETPLTSSFCTHAIRGSGVFAVEDASHDVRFSQNPLVTGRPGIRFYAGVPLQLDGARIGTLCVLDDQPRKSFSSLHENYLIYLAHRTIAALKARNKNG